MKTENKNKILYNSMHIILKELLLCEEVQFKISAALKCLFFFMISLKAKDEE